MEVEEAVRVKTQTVNQVVLVVAVATKEVEVQELQDKEIQELQVKEAVLPTSEEVVEENLAVVQVTTQVMEQIIHIIIQQCFMLKEDKVVEKMPSLALMVVEQTLVVAEVVEQVSTLETVEQDQVVLL
jgi:hypothetical protein